ncbi:response regulator [Denitromonas sp. IR12]|uniref:Response regulator n=1 Tax=Denitromonas iodatirespirans TaxID=2795389 RepID=A0A944DLH8_DENI1|nr:response regulator [Denitromonas iodatirespirans]
MVDDEQNILSALRRLLRGEGYRIFTANSGAEGIEVLKTESIDVVMSDQRMPGMSGVDFLRQAKDIQPDCVRIVLSGYTELQAVTSAINDGAIYKFLCKPWDDGHLKANIAEAVERRRMVEENRRLTQELRAKNAQLQVLLAERSGQVQIRSEALGVFHEVLDALPVGVLGIDSEGLIAFCNGMAMKLLDSHAIELGQSADTVLPAELLGSAPYFQAGTTRLRVSRTPLGQHSTSRGRLIALLPPDSLPAAED